MIANLLQRVHCALARCGACTARSAHVALRLVCMHRARLAALSQTSTLAAAPTRPSTRRFTSRCRRLSRLRILLVPPCMVRMHCCHSLCCTRCVCSGHAGSCLRIRGVCCALIDHSELTRQGVHC